MPAPRSLVHDVVARATRPEPPPLSGLERAILLTVLYADLFDYPLSEDEVYRQLAGRTAERAVFEHALHTLVGPYLSCTRGYVVWKGREQLVSMREHRQQAAPALWQIAARYARWLAWVPFVRMVAVSGSLAVENAEAHGDIDLFCITDARRLWIARLFIVPLSKLTRLFNTTFPLYLCPNYILALNALTVSHRNLFTAHEVTQAVPLWGNAAYQRFLNANHWVTDLLPHSRVSDRLHHLSEPSRPWLTRWTERLLHGRTGDALNRWMHRLFVRFYRKRAERAGWSWARLAPAYQEDRYTVPEGGYVRVVRRLFIERVRTYLDGHISECDLERFFPFPDEAPAESVYDWEGLFTKDYGG